MLPFDEISHAIIVRHVMTPLDGAETIAVSESPREAFRRLDDNRFDQAPVVDDRGNVVGLITRDALRDITPGAPLPVQQLADASFISDAAPVSAAMPRLARVPMLFVVGESQLDGFVTPSDLNKHPVRTHFYLLLSDLEMTMAANLRAFLDPPVDPMSFLSPGRQTKVRDRQTETERFNLDADVLTAFEFADLLCATRKSRLYGRFGFTSARSWQQASDELVDFRDDVMHPTSEFLGPRSIADLIRVESALRGMLTAGDGS